jgi:hypothetical protein
VFTLARSLTCARDAERSVFGHFSLNFISTDFVNSPSAILALSLAIDEFTLANDRTSALMLTARRPSLVGPPLHAIRTTILVRLRKQQRQQQQRLLVACAARTTCTTHRSLALLGRNVMSSPKQIHHWRPPHHMIASSLCLLQPNSVLLLLCIVQAQIWVMACRSQVICETRFSTAHDHRHLSLLSRTWPVFSNSQDALLRTLPPMQMARPKF